MNSFIDKVCKDIGYKVESFPTENYNFFEFKIFESSELLTTILLPKEIAGDESRDDDLFEKIETLFYNKVFPDYDSIKKKQDVTNFVNNNFPDNSPNAKVERLLLTIRSYTKHDGEYVNLFDHIENKRVDICRQSYLANGNELRYYFNYLIESGYINHPEKEYGPHPEGYSMNTNINITVKGLEQIIKAQEKLASKTCFVAMSYDKEMLGIFDSAISAAIVECNFIPDLINEKAKISHEQTLNDAILAAIKKSKFTIADFTNHRPNVYFEAGYALGRGQKVIYTCRKDRKEDVPFDLRNYPILLWETPEELKQQLKDKIEVFIKE